MNKKIKYVYRQTDEMLNKIEIVARPPFISFRIIVVGPRWLIADDAFALVKYYFDDAILLCIFK